LATSGATEPTKSAVPTLSLAASAAVPLNFVSSQIFCSTPSSAPSIVLALFPKSGKAVPSFEGVCTLWTINGVFTMPQKATHPNASPRADNPVESKFFRIFFAT